MTKQDSEKTKQLTPTRRWINERTDADRTATNNKTKQQKDKQLTPTRRWINERTDTDNTAIRWNDKTARWQTTGTDSYLTQTTESVKMIQSTGITHKQLWQKKKKRKAKTTGQQPTKWTEWREKQQDHWDRVSQRAPRTDQFFVLDYQGIVDLLLDFNDVLLHLFHHVLVIALS